MGDKNICRLCLNLMINEFEVIDEVMRQMLAVLSLKVDLNASENPILCRQCVETITKSYHFKSSCVATEEIIHSFSTVKAETEFDIKDVYVHCKDVKTVPNGDIDLCRFCMNQSSSCVSVAALMNVILYMEMLPIFMPKMAINIIKDPVVCTSCRGYLECYFKFLRNCMVTEENINRYRQNERIHSMTQIKLSNVVSFLFKNTLAYSGECTRIPMIKEETVFEEVEWNEDYEMQDKQIKYAEEVTCENLSDKFKEDPLEENNEVKLEIHDESFNYEDNTKRILKDASEIKMYKCEKCTYKAKYKSRLKGHMLTHKDGSEVDMYQCEICSYKTNNKTHIKNHLLIHKDVSEVEMHGCEICSFKTRYKKYLKIHKLVHKSPSEINMHKCGICEFETKYKASLKEHVLTHNETPEVERHVCEICGYETKYKRHLKVHILIHKNSSEVEMHKCGICAYETKYKKHLQSHMLRHKEPSEVVMHQCDICVYESKYKSSLTKHMLTHNRPEKDIQKCGLCDYETQYRFNFKKHSLTHIETE